MKPTRLARMLLLIVTLWLPAGPALAGDAGPLLREARAEAAAGRYQAAAERLAAAYRQGAVNADLCLGAAKAWRLAGDKGRMLVWLARANRLDPGNREVRKVVAATGVALPGSGLLLSGRLSPRELIWLALAGHTLFWLGLALTCRLGRRLPGTAVILAGVIVGWLWLEADAAFFAPWLRPRGVTLEETSVLCAPEAGAEVLFTLPIGQVIEFGPVRSDFRRVTDGSDRLGWIPVTGAADLLP